MILELADTKGEISTVLRSSADKEEISMTGMSENDLEGSGTGALNATSTLDVGTGLGGFALPLDEPEDIVAQLKNEFIPARSEPLVQHDDEEFWTMAIYESGMVRVEKVNLKSDVPIDTSVQPLPLSGASKSSSPQSAEPSAPTGEPEDLEGLDPEALEELTSGLLDMFNY